LIIINTFKPFNGKDLRFFRNIIKNGGDYIEVGFSAERSNFSDEVIIDIDFFCPENNTGKRF
jgi:hypothetical protein